VLLAPMAGVTDPIFRRICHRYGADLCYTEMVSAAGLAQGNQATSELLYVDKNEGPLAVQLFGHDPRLMAEQAREAHWRLGGRLALIDVNMGCPARKIAGKGDGAALMRDPELAGRIIAAVAAAVDLPVTVKFRRGYFEGQETAVEFARMAEAAGAAAVAVHGRWATQMYGGRSDRDVIGRVKSAVGIAVIASGDVMGSEDVLHYLHEQGADAVMAARGAQGNPWLFAQAKAVLADVGGADGQAGTDAAGGGGWPDAQPTLKERVAVAREHVLGLYELFGHRLAAMRRHIAWYMKGVEGAAAIRREVNGCVAIDDYLALLSAIEAG
jgi:nifR3 family TIM-barrel protein